MRKADKVRLGGLAATGRCDALKRWFHGVREHLIITPEGLIAYLHQTPGNRHDVQGLYGLLETSFTGHLIGDNAYWPNPKTRKLLLDKGIRVTAATCYKWHYQNPEPLARSLRRRRYRIERLLSQFNQQFNAHRTLSRSLKHYIARRWAKAAAFNASRYINHQHNWPQDSVAHFQAAS